MTDETVETELIAALMPTDPAACSAAVVSVACSCGLAGSVVPVRQTFSESVVGEVPWTPSRTESFSPAA